MAESQAASANALASAQADAEKSRLAAQVAQTSVQQAEADKAAMRARLSEQLNTILQTRDSARGLRSLRRSTATGAREREQQTKFETHQRRHFFQLSHGPAEERLRPPS